MISPSERPSDWNEAAPLIPRNGGATAAALIDDNDADPKLKEAVSLTLVSSTPLERPRRPTSARRAPPFRAHGGNAGRLERPGHEVRSLKGDPFSTLCDPPPPTSGAG
ncbi:UNVERIFIED_CONTAM: hypothetical protein RMT77_019236 [Armadillidium vulgare]